MSSSNVAKRRLLGVLFVSGALCMPLLASAQVPVPVGAATPPPATSVKKPAIVPAGSASFTTKPGHAAAAEQLRRALSSVETASKELDSLREEGRKANADLRAGNALVAKGKRALADGQRMQKQGRELKRRGHDVMGDAKIAAGTKAIDDAARDIATGITQIKNAQATLNTLHARAARAHAAVEAGRKQVKAAEAGM